MEGFEWGELRPAEANGFSHCFVTTFETSAGRDAYLAHPAHEVAAPPWAHVRTSGIEPQARALFGRVVAGVRVEDLLTP
eukprot:1764972-Prymnesium_polylepis.2